MNRFALPALLALCSALLLCSCETTSGYGYYVEGLTDESVVSLLEVANQAVAERDFNVYSSLLAPGFVVIDKSGASSHLTTRADYLDTVQELFKQAKVLEVATRIMDIDFVQPGRTALVKVQEEEYRVHLGTTQHYSSIIEMEIGYEDGWMFFEKSTRTAMQIIAE